MTICRSTNLHRLDIFLTRDDLHVRETLKEVHGVADMRGRSLHPDAVEGRSSARAECKHRDALAEL